MNYDIVMIIFMSSLPGNGNLEKFVLDVFTDPNHVVWQLFKTVTDNLPQ